MSKVILIYHQFFIIRNLILGKDKKKVHRTRCALNSLDLCISLQSLNSIKQQKQKELKRVDHSSILIIKNSME